MSEIKHTQGPWDRESKKGPHNVDGTVSSIGIFSVSKFYQLVDEDDIDETDAIEDSWVCGIWGSLSDEDEANANLISAAPELLEALKSFQSYGCPVCSGDCGSANPPVISCPMQIAEAAIAKAEGR